MTDEPNNFGGLLDVGHLTFSGDHSGLHWAYSADNLRTEQLKAQDTTAHSFTFSNAGKVWLLISNEGRITLGPDATPDEAAAAVFEILKDMVIPMGRPVVGVSSAQLKAQSDDERRCHLAATLVKQWLHRDWQVKESDIFVQLDEVAGSWICRITLENWGRTPLVQTGEPQSTREAAILHTYMSLFLGLQRGAMS